MVNFNKLSESKIGSILLGIGFTVVCFLVQHGSTLYERVIRLPISFEQTGEAKWSTKEVYLPAGTYFVSVGRPKGGCDLTVNSNTIASTKSAVKQARDRLLLGGSFISSDSTQPVTLGIFCSDQGLFRIRLSHTPVIATYNSGMILQIWRAATELFLGPFFSVLLLITILIQSYRTPGIPKHLSHSISYRLTTPAAFFSIISLLYSISLAHYPRLFLSDLTASSIHIILRNLFGLAFVVLYGSYSRQNRIALALHGIALVGIAVTLIVDSTQIAHYYDRQYIIFPITAALVTWQLFRTEARSQSILMLRYLGTAWSIVQILDTMALWTRFGAYTAPAMLALMAITIGYIKFQEKQRSEQIEHTSHRILTTIEAKCPVREILIHLANITFDETHFSRVSAYIDGFCIGYADQPRKLFVRVMENGYKKDTLKDSQIDFQDGRGTYMAKAIELEKMILRKSTHDSAWFIVVPLGKHAVLNLSDDKPSSPYSAYESEEVLKRLLPALQTLNTKLIDHGLRQGFALEQLRSIYGDGKFDCEVGSVFADINDYSHYSDRYGPAFSDFISAVYFPALIKAVSKWAVPEFVRGDEIYFVSIRELLPDNTKIQDAVMSAICEIYSFIHIEGATLCEQHGFQPLNMCIGATAGVSAVICDPIKVRTAGHSVNEAKRLQEAAGHGEILIKAELVQSYTGGSIIFGEETPVLIKKNFIMARRVLHLRERDVA